MSAYPVGAAQQCASFHPGHRIHRIHWRRLVQQPGRRADDHVDSGPSLNGQLDWRDVEVNVDPGSGLVQLTHDDGLELLWYHDADQLRLAADDAGAVGLWCRRYSTLLVPGGFTGPARRSFFYLSSAPSVRPCVVPEPQDLSGGGTSPA